MTAMFAFTVWQPWASLIAEECKPLEFRHWPIPERYRHRPIGIHAGGRPVRVSEVRDLLLRLHSSHWRETGLLRDKSIAILEKALLSPRSLPLSSVLCTCCIGDPIRNAELERRLGVHVHNDSDRTEHTNWAWPLSQIRRLEPFVPVKGARGFWPWNAEGKS